MQDANRVRIENETRAMRVEASLAWHSAPSRPGWHTFEFGGRKALEDLTQRLASPSLPKSMAMNGA